MILSVIIPAYNAAGTIGRCLDSVLFRKRDEVEVIVVDDGSTDTTASIAAGYGQAIRLISLGQNRGVIEARKAGITSATGDYVAFVDADDSVEPGIWNQLIDAAGNADIVIYGYDEIAKGSSRKGYFRTIYSHDKEKRIRQAITLKTDPYLWTKMVRRSILESIAFPPESMAEDWAMSVQYAMAADDIIVIDKPLYHYNVDEGSFSHDISSEERILARARSEKGNVEFIEKLFGSMGLTEKYRTEMDSRKSVVKQLLFPALGNKENLKLWKQTFPEINWKIFFNRYTEFKYKVKHLIAISGFFPIFLRLKGKR